MTMQPPARPVPLLGLAPAQATRALGALDLAPYRARQVLGWIYRRHATDFGAMTDLPRAARERITGAFTVTTVAALARQSDPGSGTHKILVGLADGRQVEGVILINRDRAPTLCVSSQVGCPVGCLFCATGRMGFARNLSSEEMLGQITLMMKIMHGELRIDQRPNVVFMGMGEPLYNVRQLAATLEALTDPERIGLGQRHVTVSTIGVPEGIRALARLERGYHLALSLHHPDEGPRRALMPRVRAPLSDVLAALREYADVSGRMITFEYVLLGGKNDGPAQADGVVRRVEELGRPTLVNLIPLNPVEGAPFERSRPEVELAFLARLRRAGVRATLRRTQGVAIDAACGQLALEGFGPGVRAPRVIRPPRPATAVEASS